MDPNKHSKSIHRSTSEGNSGEIQFQLNSVEVKWLARQDQFFNDALVERQTAFLGWRDDKKPTEVVLE